MGLILDSNVVIAAERRGYTVRQALEDLRESYGETEMGISVVTIVELVHGVQRAKEEQHRVRRHAFIDELVRDIPVHPVTIEIAARAGRMEGKYAAEGVSIAFEDLLIAATALHLGLGVVTSNVRHFHVIRGLTVIDAK